MNDIKNIKQYIKENQISIDMVIESNSTIKNYNSMRQQLTEVLPANCGVTKSICTYCCPCCEHRKD